MHPNLLETKELLFDKLDFTMSNIEIEKESAEYCAHRFEINNRKILFRQARITPTKVGQFVTLWKRNSIKSVIEPFEASVNIDLFVINVKSEKQFGQFVFSKSILIEKGIISDKKVGKRAIRVYPIWDLTQSKQAQKTQNWQLDYFLDIRIDGNLDINRAKLLYQ